VIAKKPRAQSAGEAEFALWLRQALDIPPPIREYQFHPERKWRFDFAWAAWRLAVEIEGVTAAGGRHQRIGGFKADLEKYGAAFSLGWRVYRCDSAMVSSGAACSAIEHAFRMMKAGVW
jgi:hypothetical protein